MFLVCMPAMSEFMVLVSASLYARAHAVFSPPLRCSTAMSWPFCCMIGVNPLSSRAFMLSSISVENHCWKRQSNSWWIFAITYFSIVSMSGVK